MPHPAIRTEALRRTFKARREKNSPAGTRPDFVALDGITLEIRQGELFGLLGSNGAGKTSLVRAIGGMLPPKAGRICFDGIDTTEFDSSRTCELGIGQVAGSRADPGQAHQRVGGLRLRLAASGEHQRVQGRLFGFAKLAAAGEQFSRCRDRGGSHPVTAKVMGSGQQRRLPKAAIAGIQIALAGGDRAQTPQCPDAGEIASGRTGRIGYAL